MKKNVIIVLLVFGSCILHAMPGRYYHTHEENISLNKILFNGLVKARIEFSQDEYGVGDIVDATIHFEVNTQFNSDDLKFAVIDPVIDYLYKANASYETISQKDIESAYVRYQQKYPGIEMLERNGNLILSNENPIGEFPVRYEIIKKANRLSEGPDGEKYRITCKSIKILSFQDEIKHDYITEYPGYRDMVCIPIKLKESAYQITEENKKKNTSRR